MRKRTLSTLLVIPAVVASFAGAGVARADSIAYVKDGSVWLSTGDGSRQFQVTDGGGYSEVSQSDDGHLVALRGDKLAYLDRQGTVLADIMTPVSTSTNANQSFHGPFDPVISPDGKKVAYTYYYQYTGYDPYCNPTTNCYVKQLYQGTAYTYPDRLTAWDEPGMRRQTGWIHPDWIGNDLTMLSDPAILPNEDIVMSSPTLDKDAGFTRWFEHYGAGGWHDADLSTDQKKLAGVAGKADDHIYFAHMNGLPVNGGAPNYPTQCSYEIKGPAGGAFKTVSWSPDASRLAYTDGAGINTIAIPAFGAQATDCGVPSEESKLLIPGGASPSWGPADVPAPRAPKPTPAPDPVKSPDAGNGGVASGVKNPAGGGMVVGGGKPGTAAGTTVKLKSVLAKGLPVTVQVSGAGTLTVTVKRGGKAVASAKAKTKAAGAKTIKATFTRAARKSLANAKQAKFTISTTFKPTGGGVTIKQFAQVTIKR